ncbi:MAG TPA: outer membrane beta-barrel protein [Permianibacter sp.]|nr:outer membrane beta-barrel protein [Permianibacter sp.]
MRNVVTLVAFALATTATAQVSAAETALGIARTKAKVEDLRLDESYKLFINHMFNDYVGVEISHGKYGEYVDALESEETKFVATNLAAIGAIPLSENFSLFGKLGISEWKFEVDAAGPGNTSETGHDPVIGLGLDIRVGSAGFFKIEFEKLDTDEGDAESTNLGIGFRF